MDSRGFERAAAEQKDRVHGYACRMLRDAEEARDVAQEALLRLWKHRRGVSEDGARVWLLRTVHNLCIDRIRRRRVRSEVAGENVIPFVPANRPGPHRLTQAGQIGSAIHEAVLALPPIDRAAVLLREVEGLPYDEISTTLGLRLGTLKARLHRAREKLRLALVRAGVAP